MDAFGYCLMATHSPAGGNVEQVRATLMGVQVKSACGQIPTCDSDEQAKYGLDVS